MPDGKGSELSMEAMRKENDRTQLFSSTLSVRLGSVQRYTCFVDGREIKLQGSELRITGLTREANLRVHSVRCGRDTEAAFGETVLESLWLDPGATAMDPLPPRGLRLEVVGDSIAAGAAAEAPARSGAHGNESNEDALGPLGSSR
ncbi:unnamed protein product [Effrenium voratum]|nr:unnamed protein product [Effrenium voratum]